MQFLQYKYSWPSERKSENQNIQCQCKIIENEYYLNIQFKYVLLFKGHCTQQQLVEDQYTQQIKLQYYVICYCIILQWSKDSYIRYDRYANHMLECTHQLMFPFLCLENKGISLKMFLVNWDSFLSKIYMRLILNLMRIFK